MPLETGQQTPIAAARRMAARKDVLSGLLFVGVGALGLWLSRDYPVGTALRMGTGYMPRLLCWLLIGLGGVVLLQGIREAWHMRGSGRARERREPGAPAPEVSCWRAVALVPASLAIFALAIERLGLVLSILLLIGVGALAARGLKPVETALAAITLVILSWAIFIAGLGLTIPVWPER
jgi:hypothetical protein